MATTSTSALFEVVVIIERARHAEALAGGVGGFAPAGGQRRDLEVVGERLQSRDVRHSRPSAIRVGADNADTNPLVSILARGGHTLSWKLHHRGP